MTETIFKPKYPSLYIGSILTIPFGAFLFYRIFYCNDRTAVPIFLASILGLAIISLPFIVVKRITFQKQSFKVEKYILPAKIIAYDDIIKIDDWLIKTRQGNISLNRATNLDELHRLLKKHMQNRKEHINFSVMSKMVKKK